jgi:hypothetical protein
MGTRLLPFPEDEMENVMNVREKDPFSWKSRFLPRVTLRSSRSIRAEMLRQCNPRLPEAAPAPSFINNLYSRLALQPCIERTRC